MATALHVQAEFVDALTQLRLDHARWAGFDMIRANTMTIPGLPWAPDDPYGPFHPYGGDAQDPVLVARFDRLVDLPEDSLGNALFHHYKRNGYTWPGDPDGLAELWAINHDCLHLLSGYSTSAQGELLVAAFTGGQFDPHVDFMESHVLPTVMIYHLGIDINKGLNAGDKARMEADPDWADNYEGNVHLGLDAATLWVAITNGRAMTENLYSGHWDFWAHAPEPLEDLRSRWSIPPLDPTMAALDDDQIHRETTSAPACLLLGSSTPPTSPTALPDSPAPPCNSHAITVQAVGRTLNVGRRRRRRDADRSRRGGEVVVSTMGTQATVERLKAVDLLRNCTHAQLEEVAQLAERVQVGAGEVLAREGRIGREFFLILTGSVAVTQQGRRVNTLGAGVLRRAGRHGPRPAKRHGDGADRSRRAHYRAPRVLRHGRHPWLPRRAFPQLARRLRTAEDRLAAALEAPDRARPRGKVTPASPRL